jgi:hypothetical protein
MATSNRSAIDVVCEVEHVTVLGGSFIFFVE